MHKSHSFKGIIMYFNVFRKCVYIRFEMSVLGFQDSSVVMPYQVNYVDVELAVQKGEESKAKSRIV